MTTNSTTFSDNNTSTDLTLTTTTVNATINLNNSSGDDSVTTDGTGTTTVNANNSSGDDTLTINGAGSATVNLNNSTGSDDVDIGDMSGAPLTTTVNLNNSTGKGDNVDIAGTTVNATVNMNNSGVAGYSDDVSITGTNVNATVNLNNSAGNDAITIVGSSSTNATVALNNSGGNDDITIGSNTGATTATVNLNASGGTDIVNVVGATTTATVNLANSTGQGDIVVLKGQGTGTINATNSTGNDTLIGANSTDTITGGTGNDIVDLEGAGTIYAGGGNDLGVYNLSDHYSLNGGVLQSIHGDVDYYYGQGGTNTLRIVLTSDQASLAAVKADLAAYSAFLATNPGLSQTYTFHFGASSGALTVSGWQTLQISVVTPAISGAAREGQTLTASVTLTGGETGAATYQWQISANGSTGWTNIIGATASTYSPREVDENHYLRVQAVFTDGIGETVTATSTATTAALDAAPTVTTPLISGTAQEGQTLTAAASSGQSDNPVSYAWYSSADNYANPIGSGATYLVKEGDEGKTIEVKATATNDNGVTISATSAATTAVLDAAPTVTTPLISGTAQEGQTLTATASSGQSDNPVSYSWYSSADNYANPIGTGLSYLVKEGDEGKTIEVKATATNDNGVTASATSTATSAVLDAAPTVTTPLISGTAQEGQTLTAAASSGQSDNPVSYAWYSSADNYANPIGTGLSYLVKEGDEGKTIEVKATATNDNGVTISATSAATTAVLDAAPTVTTPLISGTAQEGQTLTAAASSGQSDNAVSYAWYSSADNYANPIGTGLSYLVKEGDEGNTIEVKATATNDNGVTISATSAATTAVLDAVPTVTTPLISGTAQEGQTLTAAASSGQSDNPVSYAWYSSADNYANPIGSGATYLVKEGDETYTIEVKATATNDNGATISATSAATTAVLDAAPTVTTPLISGTVQEDQTLTAAASAGQSDNPVTYQWQQDGHDINGATGASYVVQEGDEGHKLDVVATATNDNGVTASATSAPTGAVLDAVPTVSTPAISGTVQEGQTLTATAASGQSDNPVSYQWQRDGSDINGATGASYVVQEGDEGHKLDVMATATNDNGVTASATSAATSAVLDAAPTVTTPLISGTAQEGQTLTAAAASGQSDNAVSYAWYSSADNYANPIGTGLSYLVKEGDETDTIEVKATATNDNGVTISATSAATTAVLDAAPTVTTPLISGTAQEGQTLTAAASSGQSDNPVSYAWYSSADNYANPIGSGATYLVKEGDEGNTIEVKATATNDNGVTISATSAATTAVLDAVPTVTTPLISGTAQEGQTLTAAASSGQSDNPVTYQWQQDGHDINGATGASYVVQEGDEGHKLDVVATATNDNGVTASATSAPTGAVLDAAPTVTTPTIAGTAQEGQTLTASAASGQSDNPVSYQWQRDGSDINGATGASYVVQEGDEGHKLDVMATATNDNGVTASATSAATSAVLDAAPTVTTPLISGTAQEGQTLTAAAASGQSDNAVSYAWYSSADNYANPIGTGLSYLVKEGDETDTIEVKATATNDNGVTISATSAATTAVLDAAPTVTTPLISGTAQEGQTLTAAASSGQSDNPVSYAWYSSADNYANPIGSGATYLVKEGDEGNTIEVKATATNDNGVTISATSAATTAVLDAAPTVTTPLISGTAQEGQTLTAAASSGQSDNPVSYAWYSSADNYANPIGSGATYLVKEGDETYTIEVKATATNDNGATISATSAATTAVLDAAPTVTTPLISGTAQEDQTLTAAASSGQSDNPVTYQWQQDGHDINGATGASYVVQEGDEGHKLDVVATATNDNGVTASATSAPTGAVLDAVPTVSTPAISGTVQEGQTLTATAASGQSDNPVSYQWQRDGSDINGATGASYVVQEGDEGHKLDVMATATNDNGVTASATSAATSAVLDAAPTVTTPLISGTAQEGQTLTAAASSGQSDNAVSYAWYSSADNYANPIGTGLSYLVKEGDEGKTIEVKATATNDNGVTASATSTATSAVLDAAPTITTPLISGTAQEGQTLTAAASSGQSDNPVSYAWYSSADNYANPISSGATYLVKEGDEGNTIEVKATATNDNGVTISATSAATTAVLDAAPTVTTPLISGTAQEGQTLTAAASSGQSDNPVTYQWQQDGHDINGATGASYVVQEGDEGHKLDVVATATNDNGVTASATSAPTGAVLDAVPTVSTPAISGTVQEGQTLTATAASGQSDNPVSYQWQRDGSDINGATGASYVVQEGDEGHKLDVMATATNDNGVTASATSAATSAVLDAAPTVTTPLISGTAQEGQTLTAAASSGQSDNAVSYAWYSSADNYANPIGTGLSYLVKEGDETDTIEVKATATNDNGVTISATSAATTAVLDAAPTVTTPLISGTAQEGQTLTAAASSGQSDNPVTYQWQQDGHDINGATGASYVVQEGDEGHKLDVVATATNENGVTASATSAPTGAVLDAAPTVTTPTIAGTAQEGQTLTASAASGQSDNPVSYQWQRDGSDINGATGASYVVQEGDEGHTLDVVASATNEQNVTATATSAATGAVIDAAPTVTTPTIVGTTQEGQTLTATAASGQSDNPVSYQWQRDGSDINGATGASYVVQEGDEGHKLDVVATATNEQNVTATATSAATGAVIDAAPTVTTPTIVGTTQEGQTLTATAASGQSDNPVSYQWQRDGSDINGATGASYVVQEGDEGHTLDVVASATNEQNVTAMATSAATGAVIDAAPTVTTPTIAGTAQEGQTLTASAASGQSDNPVSYQWQRDGSDINGATGASYVVQEGDEGHTLDVVASATNEQNVTATATSAATGAVIDAAPIVTTPTISGTAQEGQTLTASAASGQSDNPVSYQWQRDGSDINGATGASYVVQEGDEGHTLDVVASATNEQNVTATATSAATGAVIDAAPTVTTPTIVGTTQEGQTLTATAASGQSDNPVSYQWQRDGSDINGATGASYVVQEGDEGHKLDVVASATNEQNVTASAASAPTGAVLDAAPTVTTPTIAGTAQEGQTLTASAASGQSDNPVSYQWQRDGSDINGATGASYVVQEGDEGHTLDVVASATNEQNVTAMATSAATGAVIDAAPTVTTPTIAGTAQEGQTLTASAASGQSDNPVSYAWYSSKDGDANPIGVGSTYLVKEGDETYTIEVKASATNEQNVTATATSAATGAVIDAAPTVTTPTIAGTAQEGHTLTASAASGQSDNPVSYAWYSSKDGDANPIGIGSTYLVKEGDETYTIEVKASATNEQNVTATATSAATGAVIDAAPTVTTPTIAGTAQEGQTLTASAASGQSDNPVSYAWYSSKDGYANPIGTGSTYLVKEGDETYTIEVKASATNEQNVTATATSAATGAVTDITLAVSTAASITGTAQEGQVLTAVNGTLNDSDAAVTGYQWTRDGVNISGATASTYIVTEADETHLLRVVETATDADGGPITTSTSAPTASVTDIALAFATPASITGTAQEGQVLTAVNGTLNDSDAAVTGYQWTRDGVNISGATASTYIVTEGDETHLLRVVETATDADGGPITTSTSAPTASVTEISLKPTIAVASNTGTNGTNKATAVFTVTFAEAVSGVTTADFVPFGTETTASITSVSGSSGSSFTVTVNYTSNGGGGDRGKSLGINFVNNTTVHDSEAGESGNLAVNTNITTPQISSLAPVGTAESPINLGLGNSSNIGAVTTLIVSGMPSDWSLNQGAKNGDGSWTVTTSDPSSLMATTGSTFAGAMLLNVSESWTNADGSAGGAFVSDNVEAYPASPIFAVSGDDTLTGGSVGNNEFVFAQPIGNDTVYNFNAGNDTIDLIGFTGLGSFADIQSKLANDANGDAVVTVGSSETITVVGVGSTTLTASNFIFNQEPTTTNAGALTIGDGAMLPLGGTIDNTGTIAVNSTGDETDLEVLIRSATLEGGGQVVLSDNSQNVVFGGDASAVLTNVDNTISGAGQLGDGQMTLVNQGVINATGSNALVVNTGSSTVVNTGTLEATGSGGLVVNSAVSGGGNAVISGSSTLEFAQASDANVSFAVGAAGTLKLDQSGSFTGTVSGFAVGEIFDLADIGFSAVATLGYAANALGTGGTLTVSDGTHTTNLALLGQYAAAGFQAAADQGGATIITYTQTQAGTTDSTLLSNPQHTA